MKIQHILVTCVMAIATLTSSANAQEGFFLTVGGINGEAADGHKLEGQYGTIYKSVDGENWEQVFKGGPVKEGFNHANNNMLRCLTYGKGRFVATGNPDCVVVSEDGEDWRIVNAPSGSMSVEFGNVTFLAPNASNFMKSTDGLNWTSTRQPGDFPVWGKEGAGHVRKTVFGNGVFVCVGEQRLSVTEDGETWKHNEIFTADQKPGRFVLLFGNGMFVWLTQERGALRSENGIDWTPITSFPDLGSDVKWGQSGVFDGEKFIVMPDYKYNEQGNIYSSTDGINWKIMTADVKSARFSTAGAGLLLQNDGWSKSFNYSKDAGKSWKKVKANVGSRKVYYFDGQQIIGQSGG